MRNLAWSLRRGLAGLVQRRIVLLVMVPVVGAMLVWGGVALAFWREAATGASGAMRLPVLAGWLGLAPDALDGLAGALVGVAAFLGAILTALLVIATAAMPVIVGDVARREFPTLEPRRGGSNLGSVANALGSLAAYLGAVVVTLPLWLVPPLAFVVPWLLTAWLNQRLFRYDALAEHASVEERAQVIQRARARLFVLAGILALLQFVPLLNLVAPIYAALAFAHFCLRELAELRAGRAAAAAG